MNFEIYLFKKKDASIDVSSILKYFLNSNYYDVDLSNSDEEIKIKYFNKSLGNDALITLSRTNIVPNMYRIDPSFKSLNFNIKFSLLTPSYFAKDVLKKIEKMALMFNLYIYHRALDDIANFNLDNIMRLYLKYQVAIKVKKKELLETKFSMDEEKLNEACEYQNYQIKLNEHYKQFKINVEKIIPLYDKDEKKIVFSMKYEENKAAIFPDILEYIHYKNSKEEFIIKYSDLHKNIEKYLIELPNQNNHYLLKDSAAKSIKKINKKSKIDYLIFKKVDLNDIIGNK